MKCHLCRKLKVPSVEFPLFTCLLIFRLTDFKRKQNVTFNWATIRAGLCLSCLKWCGIAEVTEFGHRSRLPPPSPAGCRKSCQCVMGWKVSQATERCDRRKWTPGAGCRCHTLPPHARMSSHGHNTSRICKSLKCQGNP